MAPTLYPPQGERRAALRVPAPLNTVKVASREPQTDPTTELNMPRLQVTVLLLIVLSHAAPALAAEAPDLQPLLSREIIGPQLSTSEVQDYCGSRGPAMPEVKWRDGWEKRANGMRAGVLE